MGTLELKSIVADSLKTDDPNLLKKLVEVIENYRNNNESSVLTDEQKSILDVRKTKHESGGGKLLTWKEVKQELKDNHGL